VTDLLTTSSSVRAIYFAATVTTALAAIPLATSAQSYYNLDAGRPTRVEDATPAARHELSLQLLQLRFEQVASGSRRWRTDPKLSYGIAPFTEIEVRVPMLVVDPGVAGRQVVTGVGGVGVGGLHAFTLETGSLPALAVAAEWLAPVGSLAASHGSYSVKGLGTKTFRHLRLHANAGVGTWSVRSAASTGASCPPSLPPGAVPPPGCGTGQPTVTDTPCDRTASEGLLFACMTRSDRLDAPMERAATTVGDTIDGRLGGPRFVVGLGADHAFGLASTLITADVVVERYVHLYADADLAAEIGMRHQWSPQIVLDFGVGRHFSGPTRSNTVTLGLSYDMPIGQSRSRHREGR
jgi:hypothetical protein